VLIEASGTNDPAFPACAKSKAHVADRALHQMTSRAFCVRAKGSVRAFPQHQA
jgi:hypothetical protein